VQDDAFLERWLNDVKDNEHFRKHFIRATTTFSNAELHADRSTEQTWRTFDNKFMAIGAVLK